MKRCIHTVVCLVTALHLVGGHWGMLQLVAWAKMLNEFSSDRSVLVAVKDTLDGEHACTMCKKIAAEKGKEQQQTPLPAGGKDQLMKWFSLSPSSVLPEPLWRHAVTGGQVPSLSPIPLQRDVQPSVPPPERVA